MAVSGEDRRAHAVRLIRTVSPPMVVAIDLGALYGRTPHFEKPPTVRAAVTLSVIVLGHLESWVLSMDQGWFGACTYRVRVGEKHFVDQHHFVPQWALRQASRSEIETARHSGQLRW